jgi:2-(1,2-epoxy-1,2-dihydrophenyl)acetyl-CoA isomerase
MVERERVGDLGVEIGDDFVTTVEIQRPPENYFDQALIAQLADTLERLDAEDRCRAIVLCAQGKHFCAGANFQASASAVGDGDGTHLYDEAVRLFATRTPVIAAVQGAAIGGGLGLALFSDFRVASAQARFSANFARLGFHHGFGLTVTLPRLVGPQVAMDLLYTGRRVSGDEAHAIGLCDRLAPPEQLREQAHEWALEIATSAPLAVRSIRDTLRGDLAKAIRTATDRERAEQERLQKTDDFREGVRAMGQRRQPDFKSR